MFTILENCDLKNARPSKGMGWGNKIIQNHYNKVILPPLFTLKILLLQIKKLSKTQTAYGLGNIDMWSSRYNNRKA